MAETQLYHQKVEGLNRESDTKQTEMVEAQNNLADWPGWE